MNSKSALKYFSPLVILLSLYFLSSVILNSGSISLDNALSLSKCSDMSNSAKNLRCPDFVEFALVPMKINTDKGTTLEAVQSIFPRGGYLGSSETNIPDFQSLVYHRFSTKTSALNSPQLVTQEVAHSLGANLVQIRMNKSSSNNNFPFDNYDGTYSVESVEQNSLVPTAISVFPKFIDGWKLKANLETNPDSDILGKPYFQNGTARISIHISRSSASIFLILMLCLVMLLVAVGSLLVVISIHRKHRPPSLAALLWIATGLFASLHIRSVLPGAPPIGVKLDNFVTYPSIFLMFASMVIATLYWTNREDWDSRNFLVKSEE